MRKIFIILLFIGVFKTSFSQELNCTVQIISDQIAGTDKRVFDAMKTAVYEFMNNHKWTTENFKTQERIDCSILINLTAKTDADEYKGTLQIQSRRPIFKTNINSVLLNYNDNDIIFKFQDNQPLEFVENTYTSNLASILAYYAYLVIGLDYDSFALNGGTPYFQKCIGVVNNAQSSGYAGWKAFDSDKNRYWIINNMIDASYTSLRECMYNYHRK
ncbi:MAG: type IX secretion system protein PorD, partial [Bacteroidia bacterium]